MTINEMLQSLEEQAQDRDRLADGDPESIFTRDAQALRIAAQMLGKQAPQQRYESICRAALEKWGADLQVVMVFEEMAELQKELVKHLRGIGNVDHIAEEIADVQIMLKQMILLYNCKEAVERWNAKKMIRLEQRIGGENETD